MGSIFKKKQHQLSGTIEALTAEHQMQGFSKESTRLSSSPEQKAQCLSWLELSCFRRRCHSLGKRCRRAVSELMQTSLGTSLDKQPFDSIWISLPASRVGVGSSGCPIVPDQISVSCGAQETHASSESPPFFPFPTLLCWTRAVIPDHMANMRPDLPDPSSPGREAQPDSLFLCSDFFHQKKCMYRNILYV